MTIAPRFDVAVIMGSQSDWETMRHATETLAALGISFDARIISAHRTPERMMEFAKGAKAEGFKVIIAGAGGAAHEAGQPHRRMRQRRADGRRAHGAVFLAGPERDPL